MKLEDVHVAALEMLENLPAGGRILDAPAGNARMAAQLALKGQAVTCGDISVPADLPAGVQFQPMDLNQALPFADASFDAVVSNEGLQYIRRPYDLIAEFGRVLRKDGVLLLSMPNVLHVFSRYRMLTHGNFPAFKELYAPHPPDWDQAGDPVSPFTYLQLRYAMAWAGLQIETVGVARLKWSRLVFLPLILLIKFVWLFASADYRRRRHISVVNSLAVLLSDEILIRARKTDAVLPPPRVSWPSA
jgi:SAM-dependent methyltransferase